MVRKVVLNKAKGNITFFSFNEGQGLPQEISGFDKYIQIIDGVAELIINEIRHDIKIGEGIIIPAHTTHIFNAREKFKMISTIFQGEYDR